MRGSLDYLFHIDVDCGIIPAGAGLTRSGSPTSCAARDHPRGCGAHTPRSIKLFLSSGSSPRVRGSPRAIASAQTPAGIIPAGAGLTIAMIDMDDLGGDHPRGCGAHEAAPFSASRRAGSSPRVRGSRFPKSVTTSFAGIIPAGAGLTPVRPLARLVCRDHPRGCGAHLKYGLQGMPDKGSSPRVRGSRRRSITSFLSLGIIPAGAGLTQSG